MDNKKVGEFLASRRDQLELSFSQMAQRLGCNRTTIERMEKGICCIRRTKVTRIAQAYEVEISKLAELCGYPINTIDVGVDWKVTASVADLEFLIKVARGLQKPMNFMTIRELLKCRQAK